MAAADSHCRRPGRRWAAGGSAALRLCSSAALLLQRGAQSQSAPLPPWLAQAPVNAYTGNAVGVDEAMYERDDFVVLFAAGNDGQDNGATVTQGTVGAPGTAKNSS